MEGKKRRFPWRAARWERMLLTAVATVLSGEVFFNLGNDNFRISGAVVLFPVLLLTLLQDSRTPLTGVLTGACLLLVRSAIDIVGGGEVWTRAILLNCPAAIFYPCYDGLLCLLVRDRYQAPLSQLWWTFWLCDGVSNIVNFSLDNGGLPNVDVLAWLMVIGLARALLASLVLWGMKRYRRLLLAEEHERRYQRLFLMTANLKNELYFLKKDAENIEGIMARAYRLYERLGELDCPEEVRQLALSIARDVHEVKKDNLSIVRGIEGEVAGTGTDQGEQMWMSDLFLILQDTMRHILGEKKADIDLLCRCESDFATGEHYRIMSILKNLVINAAEAIQSGKGTGVIWVDERVEEGQLLLTVQDNGPGITPRAMRNLFQVGYSTKFDPKTGNISRGIGLPAVEFMVQELGGSVQVASGAGETPKTPGGGARFEIKIPMNRLEKGEV